MNISEATRIVRTSLVAEAKNDDPDVTLPMKGSTRRARSSGRIDSRTSCTGGSLAAFGRQAGNERASFHRAVPSAGGDRPKA